MFSVDFVVHFHNLSKSSQCAAAASAGCLDQGLLHWRSNEDLPLMHAANNAGLTLSGAAVAVLRRYNGIFCAAGIAAPTRSYRPVACLGHTQQHNRHIGIK
jgi:hypothetical protein